MKRICLIGNTQDLTAVYIAWLAKRRGAEVFEFDEEKLGIDWEFEFEDGRNQHGYFKILGTKYEFSKLNGAVVRFRPNPGLPSEIELPESEGEIFLSERRASLEYLVSCLPCAVANRTYAGRGNGSKPYQMRQLKLAGFRVPKWVVGNDERAVMEFSRTFEDGVIYKSCSGIRSRVRRLNNKVLRRLRAGTTPIIIQEYIKGTDVRVHVVGHRSFATEVVSTSVDYRFDDGETDFRIVTIPAAIDKMCIKMAECSHLLLAGFDFRVSEEGDWYCLEMNPVPSFLPYEMETDQSIGGALLEEFGVV